LKRIGIITALIREANSLTNINIEPNVITPIGGQINILVCGMGSERAHSAAHKLIDSGCDALISWGTAGALMPNIKPGALIIPESIITQEEEIIQTASKWRRTVVKELDDCPDDVYLGRLSDTMQVITSSKEKYAAREQGDSLAVDMESATIALVARQKNIPFISIRAISDSAYMSIPESILNYTDPYGRVKISRLIPAILKRPADIPKIINLAMGYRSASRTLKWSGKKLIQLISKEM
jgi:adenosylhomocysteine nucleosidase